MVRLATKIKCPHCGKQVLKRILIITHGKCNNCGYSFANPITTFLTARSRIQNKYTLIK